MYLLSHETSVDEAFTSCWDVAHPLLIPKMLTSCSPCPWGTHWSSQHGKLSPGTAWGFNRETNHVGIFLKNKGWGAWGATGASLLLEQLCRSWRCRSREAGGWATHSTFLKPVPSMMKQGAKCAIQSKWSRLGFCKDDKGSEVLRDLSKFLVLKLIFKLHSTSDQDCFLTPCLLMQQTLWWIPNVYPHPLLF